MADKLVIVTKRCVIPDSRLGRLEAERSLTFRICGAPIELIARVPAPAGGTKLHGRAALWTRRCVGATVPGIACH